MPFSPKMLKRHMFMSMILQKRIGKTAEVYIDDMVVKYRKRTSHLEDLEDIFNQRYSFGAVSVF